METGELDGGTVWPHVPAQCLRKQVCSRGNEFMREQKWSGQPPPASFRLGTALCRKTPLSITVKEEDGRGGRGVLRPPPAQLSWKVQH